MALLTYEDCRRLFAGSARPLMLLRRLTFGAVDQLTLPNPLPKPQAFRQNRDLITKRYDGITVLRQVPAFRRKDTPIKSLYRMCEFLSADASNQLMLEMQYFWNHQSSEWRLAAIPDPRETDEERSAIIASLIESLVVAFNARLALGLRRGRDGQVAQSSDGRAGQEGTPSWTSKIPALASTLFLCEVDPYFIPTNEPFSNRNIIANAGNLFSI